MKFRSGTMDKEIFDHVVNWNEYHLPDILDPNDVIIDIGAHIGSFIYAYLKRGGKKIYAYEAFKGNYDMALSNFEDEIKNGLVKLYFLAVWRSDFGPRTLYHSGVGRNTGDGYIVYKKSNYPVNSIALDKIIEDIANIGNKIKLIKLDCEHAEFPILFTSKKLSLVDYICGEYHATTLPDSDNINGKTYFDGKDLISYLDCQCFSTIITGSNTQGIFFAKKKGFDNFFKDIIIP